MYEPNYEEYSESELENILDHIDHDKWPERVLKIESLLNERAIADNERSKNVLEIDKSNSVPIFSPKQVFIGSYLCGPLAGLYYLKLNFKNMLAHKAERITLYGGVVFIVLFSILIFFIPENTPSLLLPLTYSGIALYISSEYQVNEEKEAFSEDFRFASIWVVAKIGIISLIGFGVFLFSILFAIEYYIA